MRRASGSALLIAVISMLVVTVIGVALVRFTQHEVAGAKAAERRQLLQTCADAARRMLEAKFHALGGPQPESILPLGTVSDDGVTPTDYAPPIDGPDGRMRALGGHINDDPLALTVKQVEPLDPSALGPSQQVVNIGSRILGTSGMGTPLKVTVHCQEGDFEDERSGRQLEMEFGIRWGL